MYQQVKAKLSALSVGLSETSKQAIDDILSVDGTEHLLRQKINAIKGETIGNHM